MSNFFKILGLLLLLFGVLDLGLLSYGISLWRILGIEPWWLIGNFTYMVEIIYGALTIFVADYVKRPRRRSRRIVDLSDPLIAADPHYLAVPRQNPPLQIELAGIAKGLVWGALIAAVFLLVFVAYVPGMDGLLFTPNDGATPLDPMTRKVLIAGAVMAIVLPMIVGGYILRLRGALSGTAMVAGWAVTSVLIIAAIMETPRMGRTVYGAAFMNNVYQELGYRDGLPSEWSVEREIIARLKTAGRLW